MPKNPARLVSEVRTLTEVSESIHESSFHEKLDFYNRLQAILLEIGYDKNGLEIVSPERFQAVGERTAKRIHGTVSQLRSRMLHILENQDESKFLENTDIHFYDGPMAHQAMRDEIAIRFERTEFANLSHMEIENRLSMFDKIYKEVQEHAGKIDRRTSGHSAFSHFYETARIALEELPDAKFETILACLGHDLMEDLDMTYEKIVSIFGPDIAKIILALSKHPLDYYLTDDERGEWAKLDYHDRKSYVGHRKERLKALREEDYFGKLWEYDDQTLIAKFADRIANLRTLNAFKQHKRLRKCQETIRYFLPVAVERNPAAFVLMMDELRALDQEFSLELHINRIYDEDYKRIKRTTPSSIVVFREFQEIGNGIVRSRWHIPLADPYRVSQIVSAQISNQRRHSSN